MYRCIENELYLLFLRESLKKVIGSNKLFQSDSAEPLKLLQELNDLLYSTLQKIVVPQQMEKANKQDLCTFQFKNYLMPADCISFGFYFNQLSSKCNPENLLVIKNICRDSLIKLAEELQKQVPQNIKVLQKVCLFIPAIAFSQKKEDITEVASFFEAVCHNVYETLNEWNLLYRLEIKTCSTDEYWAQVYENFDAGGARSFQHISKRKFSLLSLPY